MTRRVLVPLVFRMARSLSWALGGGSRKDISPPVTQTKCLAGLVEEVENDGSPGWRTGRKTLSWCMGAGGGLMAAMVSMGGLGWLGWVEM